MLKDFDYKDELIRCYSDQAEHFHNTRKKFRPEVDFMNTVLQSYLDEQQSKKISLVDL